MIGLPQNQDLGNGARPRTALGCDSPIWRLGALVSLPYRTGKVMLVPTPDGSLSLRPKRASCTAEETFPMRFTRAQTFTLPPLRGEAGVLQNNLNETKGFA